MTIDTVDLDGRTVGAGHPPYIIAEACINHEGEIAIAREMVYVAHAMRCDAIKFQLHVLDDEMLRETPQSENFEDSLYDTLDRTNLSVDEHRELQELCRSVGIQYMCTPFSNASADLLESELDLAFFKTGSGELTNLPFQSHVAKKGRPVIVSTGMAELYEIEETVNLVKGLKAPLVLTHCVSAYPCPYNRVNLGNIPRYRELFGVPVGLSDHSRGIFTALGSVALGAAVIEKHFTLDKMAVGPDHASSIEPYELGELVKGCHAVWEASGNERKIFPEEQEIVAWARESVVSTTDIPSGTVVTDQMVAAKRPSPGDGAIAAKNLDDVIGKSATNDIVSDRQILWTDIA